MNARATRLMFTSAAALALSAIAAGQQTPAASYTPEQAASGRTVYMASCAGCHLPDLGGRNEASPLAGANFLNAWRGKTARELHDYIAATMPPGGQKLPADAYRAVTAFILQANSISPTARRSGLHPTRTERTRT